MNEKPLVSIIVPVYKVEKYIENSVKSVLRQTYTNIELIIINDGTPDNSIGVAKKVLAHSKINYTIVENENQGLGESRNSGMDIAKGEWICFLDSDDMLSDNAIEHLLNCALQNDADIAFSDFNEITSAQDALKMCRQGKEICFSAAELQKRFLKRTSVVLAPGTLYKKTLLDNNELRFAKIPWSEDQHFIWRVLHQIKKAVYLNEPLYQYLRRSGSIMDSAKINAMIDSYEFIKELRTCYDDNQAIALLIAPRWVMGTMNSATKMVEYREWKRLAAEINMRKAFSTLLSFPEIRVKIMALLGLCSPFLYYHFSKKINR